MLLHQALLIASLLNLPLVIGAEKNVEFDRSDCAHITQNCLENWTIVILDELEDTRDSTELLINLKKVKIESVIKTASLSEAQAAISEKPGALLIIGARVSTAEMIEILHKIKRTNPSVFIVAHAATLLGDFILPERVYWCLKASGELERILEQVLRREK